MQNVITGELATTINHLASQARQASRPIARASNEQRTQAILAMATQLTHAKVTVEQANANDLLAAEKAGLSQAMCDRLRLIPAVTITYEEM